MAKKKRQAKNSASEPAKTRDAAQELRDYYQLGLDVREADQMNPDRRTYNKGVTIKFAVRLGKGRDYVDKARQFATNYTREQLEELCALWRPDCKPLGRRHMVALLSIRDKRQRRSVQRQAAEEGWGRDVWRRVHSDSGPSQLGWPAPLGAGLGKRRGCAGGQDV